MIAESQQPLIISASRTKDMVHRSPDTLAEILTGIKQCRWGPHGPFAQIRPDLIHTIVLWTKAPENLLKHQKLHESLRILHEEYRIQVSLQITATGFGGSFLEPGIPAWEGVCNTVRELFDEGWINPKAVIYRFDPFLLLKTPSGKLFGNISLDLFKDMAAAFVSLGIRRVTTSRADAVRYPKVAQRLKALGLEWIHIPDDRAVKLCEDMDAVCRKMGVDFSVCCEPPVDSLLSRWGCIDGVWLNEAKGREYPPATETLHNQIGRQRPACHCTYSRDIGYSPGSATCYSGGFGCLYCYSQGNAKPPDPEGISAEIRFFDEKSEEYLRSKNLSDKLVISEGY
ncbi:hypothetical protein CEE37_12855 [candidate division LCP-89 bacterium B3_LCP]|uniref:DNA photolyase n=1 Tax=candidate division LCP-89 bacterium B3_LCP TaxID=2012998 RepID=A0A532UTY5_UNCL8|nr:MAG: hypothetical protein CEE37_12855 [candidate division LCP-89 bacterium B3_LCP]